MLVVDGIFVRGPSCGPTGYSISPAPTFASFIPHGIRRRYGDPDLSSASNRRYIEWQGRHLSACQPRDHATVVMDNNDLVGAHISCHRTIDGAMEQGLTGSGVRNAVLVRHVAASAGFGLATSARITALAPGMRPDTTSRRRRDGAVLGVASAT